MDKVDVTYYETILTSNARRGEKESFPEGQGRNEDADTTDQSQLVLRSTADKTARRDEWNLYTGMTFWINKKKHIIKSIVKLQFV
jgi:hypothetical protein